MRPTLRPSPAPAQRLGGFLPTGAFRPTGGLTPRGARRPLGAPLTLGAFLLLWTLLLPASPRPAVAADDHQAGGWRPSVEQEEAGRPGDPLLPWPAAAEDDNVRVTYRITSGNAMGITFFNNGMIGNNFNTRRPSFEYPLGSNIDHMPRGGFWIGGITVNGDTLVTTATVDGYINSTSTISEMYPLPNTGIEERSVLPTSRYYHPAARSEQDFLFSSADTAAALIDPSGEDPHRPMNVQLDTETLLFGYEPFEATVFMNFRIINLSATDPIYDLRAGLYTELASGWKDPAASNWSSGWFKRKVLTWVDSLRLVTEHHHTYADGRAPTWAGAMFLGSRPQPDSATLSMNWWNWDPSGDVTDGMRYRLLGNGQIDDPSVIVPGLDDPVELLSLGTFPILEAGDTLEVSFAFVGGEDDRPRSGRDQLADITFNADWAQQAYDLEFRIPRPPPSPLLTIRPDRGSVTLTWSGQDAEWFRDPKTQERDFEGYRIYISEERQESGFRRVLERDLRDGLAYDTGLEDLRDSLLAPAETLRANDGSILDVLPEVWRYRYTVDGLRDGFKYWVAVTAFDTGTIDIAPLESGLAQNLAFVIPGGPASAGGRPKVSVFPNPYRGAAAWDTALSRDRYLWFTNLPARCVIRIYTLAGDLVHSIDFDQKSYRPTDVRGIYDPTDPRRPERDLPVLSGGMAAWDLVTRKDQGIASGLYLFSVEDRDSGDRQVGKFLVIK